MPKTVKVTTKSSTRTPAKSAGSSKPASKIEQLQLALSRKAGASSLVLEHKLGWQKHTIRAAISRLRKAGADIATEKNTKTGETVYRLKPAAIPDSENSDAAKQRDVERSTSRDKPDSAAVAA